MENSEGTDTALQAGLNARGRGPGLRNGAREGLPPGFEVESRTRLLRTVFRFRLLLAVCATLATPLLPGADTWTRAAFLLMVAFLWIPWAGGLLLFARRRGRYPLVASAVGDIIVVFAFQVLTPSVRSAALAGGYMLFVAFYTFVSGRMAGWAVGAGAMALTLVAWIVAPPGQRVDGFALIVFAAAMVALILLLDAATNEQRRAEDAIGAAAEQYRTLVERIPGVVYMSQVGVSGPFIYVSPQIEPLLGFPAGEWLSDPTLWPRQVHPDDLERVTEAEERSRNAGERLVLEYRMVARDGRVVWVRDEAEVMPDNVGNPAYLRGLIHDVTARKEAEETSGMFAAIVESSADAIIGGSVDGTISSWNAAAERIFGYSAEEAIGRPISIITPPGYEDEMRANVARIGRGEPVDTYDTVRMRKDGELVDVALSISPIKGPDGALIGASGIVRDITERKRAEKELRTSYEALKKTDDERRLLASKLVTAEEEERERIAREIHDDQVQTITAVGLRLTGLRRRLSEPSDLEAMTKLEATVQSSIVRLRRMLFSLRPRVLDQDGLSSALRSHLDMVSEESGIEYRMEDLLEKEPPRETRTILYRIAQEALVNVRKHARAQLISVELRLGDGGYHVRIEDDGVGFDTREGSGSAPGHMGLTTMRERAEMAGGWWRIASDPGHGTCVTFWIPESTLGLLATPEDASETRSGRDAVERDPGASSARVARF